MKTIRFACALLLSVGAAGVAGCVMAPPQPTFQHMTTTFDTAAHEAYLAEGTGSIKGQAFLRQQGGGVVTCAGAPVFVFPNTGFFQEAISIIRAGAEPAGAPPKEELQRYLHTGQCDAQGNFLVEGLAPGSWIVTTEVTWTVGYARQGGGLLDAVEVQDGQQAQVLLSDANFVGR